ncbi:MGMT family protein [Salinispirillum sp. LH 10-3-1]|uniref:MGMT family protein n=1 Tax=Salinispirillum sp. LH 10-3-1 TaxID=2952525 RepID=A0AB38YFS7_9GAMM
MHTPEWTEQLYQLVDSLPRHQVTSYGALAKAIGGVGPRQVARAMGQLPEDTQLPWHRVIRSDGTLAEHARADEQESRLLADGIPVSRNRVHRRHFHRFN